MGTIFSWVKFSWGQIFVGGGSPRKFNSHEKLFTTVVVHENGMARREEDVKYQKTLCVREYHIYKHIWNATMSERLECVMDPSNSHDRYAVAVEKDGMIIGHLPRKVSRVSTLFLKKGGKISCTVTGGRRYSADLPQGGLEIPCTVLFVGKRKEIDKLKLVLRYIDL